MAAGAEGGRQPAWRASDKRKNQWTQPTPRLEINATGAQIVPDTIFRLLTAPIFNAGRIRAHIAARDARLDQVAAKYEQTFLLALEDVENAFVVHTSSKERRVELLQVETAAEKTYQFSESLYQRGASDYLSVLDAQRSKLLINDERVKAETAVRVSLVSLCRAFGGGWAVDSSVSRGNDEIKIGKNSGPAVADVLPKN